MQSLLILIRRFQFFLVFLLLESLSIVLMIRNNHYQNATVLNSANAYSGYLLSVSKSVSDYFGLFQVNQALAQENAELRDQLIRQGEQLKRIASQSEELDSLVVSRYEFISAQVINNSTRRKRNYITLDKGLQDGVEPGMGVISSQGIVGKVKYCSQHFSTVISLLHSDMRISAQLKKNNELGTVLWNGVRPEVVQLHEIPNYLEIQEGDTILTSGYNATFPPRLMIGSIEKISRSELTFYDLDIRLSTSFNRLDHVYVVQNLLKVEQDSLETETFIDLDE